jgi:nucleoside-diphosphate-sugar epimerase
MTSQNTVLVTGGSGFIGGHVVLALAAHGHRVRATVRSLDREAEIRAQLARAGSDPGDALELVAADLTSDEGWPAALDGVDGVMHVASPVPHGGVAHGDDEDALIVPAREGTRRVLRAAHAAGVPRVVLTSAFHAIGFGWGVVDREFTEDDWSPLDGPGMDAYGRSKVLAERAAWDLVAEQGGPELVALNPVAVLGPVIGPSLSGGNSILRALLTGAMPAIPDLWLPIVDVRDVAEAHVAALGASDAAGERIIVASGDGLHLPDVAELLRAELGEAASRIPTQLAPPNPALNAVKRISTEKERRILGLRTRDARETVLDAARSIVDAGLAD